MGTQKKVLFATKEEAEAKTGYFSVSSLMTTCELADKISSYISTNRISTYYLPNPKKTSVNTYTLNFVLKVYAHIAQPKAYLSKPGALGNYTRSGHRIVAGPLAWAVEAERQREAEKLEALKTRTPTLEQMYFWIVRKYRDDLLWMDYSVEPVD